MAVIVGTVREVFQLREDVVRVMLDDTFLEIGSSKVDVDVNDTVDDEFKKALLVVADVRALDELVWIRLLVVTGAVPLLVDVDTRVLDELV